MTFTLQQIEDAWDDYKDGQALEILKDGKITYKVWKPGVSYKQPEGATRLKIVSLSKAMTFPEFIKTWKP